MNLYQIVYELVEVIYSQKNQIEKGVVMKKLIVLLVSIVFSSVYAYAGINDGLVAYYPFNSNANDESGNGYHGIIYGATLVSARIGNAYLFNGINNYIEIPYAPVFDFLQMIFRFASGLILLLHHP